MAFSFTLINNLCLPDCMVKNIMYKVSRGGESISGPLGSRTLLLLLAIIGAFHDLPVLPRQEARQGCSLTESTTQGPFFYKPLQFTAGSRLLSRWPFLQASFNSVRLMGDNWNFVFCSSLTCLCKYVTKQAVFCRHLPFLLSRKSTQMALILLHIRENASSCRKIVFLKHMQLPVVNPDPTLRNLL